MKGIAFKGDVKDVCAELEREAKRCKGMTVGEYLKRIKLEKAEKKQFEEIMEGVSNGN